MSDLISRSALKKEISKWLKPTSRPDETEFVTLYDIAISVIDSIDEQPTAYDIDKVVEELEKESYRIDDSATLSSRDVIDIDDAIKIVKKGGISNDVCEWKDKELYGYYTSCTEFRSRIACKDTYWKYCPYCGKKIKAVE